MSCTYTDWSHGGCHYADNPCEAFQGLEVQGGSPQSAPPLHPADGLIFGTSLQRCCTQRFVVHLRLYQFRVSSPKQQSACHIPASVVLRPALQTSLQHPLAPWWAPMHTCGL